jgi:hypothetical protein
MRDISKTHIIIILCVAVIGKKKYGIHATYKYVLECKEYVSKNIKSLCALTLTVRALCFNSLGPGKNMLRCLQEFRIFRCYYLCRGTYNYKVIGADMEIDLVKKLGLFKVIWIDSGQFELTRKN